MLIKVILEKLPLTPGPKPPEKVRLTAGAAVHERPRCGEVLAVDVYNRKGELLYRFFSDGSNYITQVVQAFGDFEPGWTDRSPAGVGRWDSVDDIDTSAESLAAMNKVLKNVRDWGRDLDKVGSAIRDFIFQVGQDRRWRAQDNRNALMKRHFAMFPDYPLDLKDFCENNIFDRSVVHVSKIEKGKRKAVCCHCGKSYKVDREIKPGMSWVCPKCGWPVDIKAGWTKSGKTDKAKICIAYKVDGQLLLRYTSVERVIYPGLTKPKYYFFDHFRTLFLISKGKGTEYAYSWCIAPYCGYDWRRMRNGSEYYGCTYVYTQNLREVFGDKYYNVDLQAGLEGLRRQISFRRLLDNLKNVPQAEYLMKIGLPVLAADILPDSNARTLLELTGIGKQYLPILQECQATFREIRTVTGRRNSRPEDLRQLCALQMDTESLGLLEEIVNYNSLGRSLRYVQNQKDAMLTGPMKHRKFSYFLRLYRDYLHMAQDLKSDMGQRAVLEPRDLKGRHDLLAERVNELRSKPDNDRFQRAIDNGLYWWAREYANDKFCVIYPQKRSDLTTEGQRLNHCVGGSTYFENHIRGMRMIFFIRRAVEPDKAYFTAEIDTDTGRILQLYGFGDCSAPKEVRAFTEGFARAIVRWKEQPVMEVTA